MGYCRHAITYENWIDITEDVEQGRLQILLKNYLTVNIPLQLVYLQTKYPRKTTNDDDFLQQKFREFSKRYAAHRTIDNHLNLENIE